MALCNLHSVPLSFAPWKLRATTAKTAPFAKRESAKRSRVLQADGTATGWKNAAVKAQNGLQRILGMRWQLLFQERGGCAVWQPQRPVRTAQVFKVFWNFSLKHLFAQGVLSQPALPFCKTTGPEKSSSCCCLANPFPSPWAGTGSCARPTHPLQFFKKLIFLENFFLWCP